MLQQSCLIGSLGVKSVGRTVGRSGGRTVGRAGGRSDGRSVGSVSLSKPPQSLPKASPKLPLSFPKASPKLPQSLPKSSPDLLRFPPDFPRGPQSQIHRKTQTC